MDRKTNLVWLDLEMTGLNPECDRIIEIATVVTDTQLNILAHGPSLAVNQPMTLLDGMDDWNTTQHHQSGLVKRVKASTISEVDAEARTLAFLAEHVDSGMSPLCGNSIGQDRRFLVRYMPALADFFHYRNLDVSTLKELAKRWAPDISQKVNKKSKHLAMDDVLDSIDELRFYRQHLLHQDCRP